MTEKQIVWNTTIKTPWIVRGPEGCNLFGIFGGLGTEHGLRALDDGQLDAACDEHDLEAEELGSGDRVESGSGEDYDEGVILSVSGGRAEVAWDSQVRTTQPISLLRVL